MSSFLERRSPILAILCSAALLVACGKTGAGAGVTGKGGPNTSPTSNPNQNPDGGLAALDGGSGILHVACDNAITMDGGASPEDFAKAMGMCEGLVSAKFVVGFPEARSVRQGFGTKFVPQEGSRFVLLSSGLAVDNVESPQYSPGNVYGTDYQGMDFSSFLDPEEFANPYYSPPPCGPKSIITPSANDMTDYRVQLKVPNNASCLSFDFSFFSAEYPEWVCQQYDDRFIVALKTTDNPSGANISFDGKGNPITVNNDFFQICQSLGTHTCSTPISSAAPGLLDKTGYEKAAIDKDTGTPVPVGGATGWLTTTAPVTPGDTITLDFYVFDEGDHILDSAALIDNFHWLDSCAGAPTTTPDQDAGIPLG